MQQITVTIDDTIVLHDGRDKKFIEDRCVQVSFPPFFWFFKVLNFYSYFLLILKKLTLSRMILFLCMNLSQNFDLNKNIIGF